MNARLLLLLVTCHLSLVTLSAGQPTSPLTLYKWKQSGQYAAYSAAVAGQDLATFTFPAYGPSSKNVAYPVFLLTPTNANALGPLLSAEIQITVTGAPQFIWGGIFSWNPTGLPAHARI